MGDRTRTGYTFVEFLQPLWASSKRVFVCPENQIDTHREHAPFFTLFNNHHHHHHCHCHCRVDAVHSRFESAMSTFTLMQTKNGEFIKEEPHTTPFLKQLHFNVSLQWMSLHAIFGKKTLLFWSDIITILFSFSQVFWWPFVHGNSHWKHPLDTRKWMVIIFNVFLRC